MHFFAKIFRKKSEKRITDSGETPKICETRDIDTPSGREVEKPATTPQAEERLADHCPYCSSKDFVKRRTRKRNLKSSSFISAARAGKPLPRSS